MAWRWGKVFTRVRSLYLRIGEAAGPARRQGAPGFLGVRARDEDVVRVERRDGEDADFGTRECR